MPTPPDVLEALADPRVLRVLEVALRDHGIRRQFRLLRRTHTVADAVLTIAESFCLSEEHIRTIVYRKQGDGREEGGRKEEEGMGKGEDGKEQRGRRRAAVR